MKRTAPIVNIIPQYPVTKSVKKFTDDEEIEEIIVLPKVSICFYLIVNV